MLHPITLLRHPVEYFLEDSDLEGLSDITVSSVHTSDLSSFEGESEDEGQRSDSSEEGELPADGFYFSFLFAKSSCKFITTGPPAAEGFVSKPSFWLCFVSPDDGECGDKKQSSGEGDEDRKPRRKAYVHKPFLYSRYYSDSDDEVTVEERRRSAVSS